MLAANAVHAGATLLVERQGRGQSGHRLHEGARQLVHNPEPLLHLLLLELHLLLLLLLHKQLLLLLKQLRHVLRLLHLLLLRCLRRLGLRLLLELEATLDAKQLS